MMYLIQFEQTYRGTATIEADTAEEAEARFNEAVDTGNIGARLPVQWESAHPAYELVDVSGIR